MAALSCTAAIGAAVFGFALWVMERRDPMLDGVWGDVDEEEEYEEEVRDDDEVQREAGLLHRRPAQIHEPWKRDSGTARWVESGRMFPGGVDGGRMYEDDANGTSGIHNEDDGGYGDDEYDDEWDDESEAAKRVWRRTM
ncbi:hypothetical protein HK104_011115 [Borealophlyctis nickersoniae]|nr:hypothetical protein HK104_011115 [Borealophlyctis nickersoniae]